MTKSLTRESPQLNEQPQPHRNIYDYDGEYEFPIVEHWTAPGVPAPSPAALLPMPGSKRT